MTTSRWERTWDITMATTTATMARSTTAIGETDGFFYYSDANGQRWTRDDGQHFRHDAQSGFNPVHGRGERRADMPSHP